MKILWNLLCQYNNIYAGSYKYLKGKKKVQTKDWKKEKKKKKKACSYYSYSAAWTNQMALKQRFKTWGKKWLTTRKGHCRGIASFYIISRRKMHKLMIEKIYIDKEQTKSMVTFTYLLNKCHNIFTKYLFSIVIGYSFLFFILF